MSNITWCKNIKWYMIIKKNFSVIEYNNILNFLNTQLIDINNSKTILSDIINIKLIENNYLMINIPYNQLHTFWFLIETSLSDLIDFIYNDISNGFEYYWNITFEELFLYDLYITENNQNNWYYIYLTSDISEINIK